MVDDNRKFLGALLSDEDPAARRRAAEELGKSKGFSSIAALAAALRDENKGVRDAATRAMGAIGDQNVARAVVEYISDQNIITRNLAGEILVKLGDHSVPVLMPYLYDVDQDVRKFAVDILGLIGSDEAVKHTVKLLEDPDPNVVVSAAEALGNIKAVPAVPALIEIFIKHDYSQAVVAEALGKIKDEKSNEFLLLKAEEILRSPGTCDPIVLYSILEAISYIGSAQAIAVLQPHIEQLKGKLRRTLLHALVRISEMNSAAIADLQKFESDFIEGLKNDETLMRITSAKALGSFPGVRATEAVVEALSSEEELDAILIPIIEKRPGVFHGMVLMLEQDRIQPSKELIALMGRLLSNIRFNDIPQEFINENDDIVGRAFDVVKKAWGSATEEVRAVIVDALFKIDADRALEFLDAVVEEPDPWLRIHVIEILAPVSDMRIPGFIARFLNDDDETVREVARSVLETRGFDENSFAAS